MCFGGVALAKVDGLMIKLRLEMLLLSVLDEDLLQQQAAAEVLALD
jgi:hypothetical protein